MKGRVFVGFILILATLLSVNLIARSAQAAFIEDDGGSGSYEPPPPEDDLNPGGQQCEAASCGGDGGGGTYYPPPPPPPAEEAPPEPVEPAPDYPPPPPPPDGTTDPGLDPGPFVPPDNPPGDPGPDPDPGTPNPSAIWMGPLISYCLGDNQPVIKLNWSGGNNAYYFKVFRSDMGNQIANVAANTRSMDEYGISGCGGGGCTSGQVTRFDHNVQNKVTYSYAIAAMPLPGATSTAWTAQYSSIQAADCAPPPPPPTAARFSSISTYCAADNLPVIRMEWTGGENARYYKLFEYDVSNNVEYQAANISAFYNSFEDYTINNCGSGGCQQPGYATRFDHTVINNQYYNYIIASMPLTGAIGGIAWSSYTDAIQAPNCAPQPCLSAPNSCGQTYSGLRSVFGVCSVSAPPPNPGSFGQSCSNLANSCGDRNQGTIICDGSCSAAGRVSERPNYGTACQTPANNCGEVSTGSNTVCNPGGFQTGVSCSVTTPPVCAAPIITTGPSSSVCDNAGLIGWSGKSGLFGGRYGYSVDISLTANFATKYSKWIDSPMGTTGGSTILPTDIDWKGFNGPTDTLPGVHTWYVRVWNGAFSNTASFQTQTCLPTVDFNILYGSVKTAASATIQFEEGNIATLEWTPTNATSCTASGNSSSWSGAKAFTGTNSEGIRDLNATGSPYTLTLTCNRGSSRVVKSFTINVYKAAYIKTTGGNVHSNENINTPGQ